MSAAQLDLLAWTPCPAPRQAITLRRVDPARNMARFYRLDVQPDLFGGWSFIREWGRIGRSGTVRQTPCSGQAQAIAALEKHKQIKSKRGYR